MKRSKIILCVATLLLFAILLSSCGATKISPIKNLTKVLNADYDLAFESYTKAEKIEDLKGYITDEGFISDEFAVFHKLDGTSTTYKVLSFRTNTIILEFTTTKDTEYSFKLIEDQPALIVTKTVTETGDDLLDLLPEITSTYTLYDASAQIVATSETHSGARIVDDYIIFDYVAYTADDEGKLSKEFDLPEYMNVENFYDYNDNYFYGVNDYGIYVYDREFNRVSAWFIPDYDDDSIENFDLHILNNGDMVAQYMVVLDEDADKYDVTIVEDGVTKKMDFVSVLISAKNGKAKNIDLDYVISYVMTNNDLYDDDEENNYFTDSFENIAIINPIVDGKILYSGADKDIVIMNNKAKATKSLKVVDYQTAEIPEPIGEGLYAVETLEGGVLVIDEKGKLVHAFNNSALSVVGDYFVGKRAVYDMDLEVVYDLSQKDVEILKIMGDTILIKSGTDKEYSVIALCGGEEKTVYTHTEKSKTDFGVLSSYFYYIKNENGEFEYFNEKGDSIITTEEKFAYVGMSYEHDSILLVTAAKTVEYYVVKK